MPLMEIPEIGSQNQFPISQTNPSSEKRRRVPLRSQTVDTLLRILSICSTDSSHTIQKADKDASRVGSETKDVPFTCTGSVTDGMLHQKEIFMDEVTVVLRSQDEVLCTEHVESPERDHNVSREMKDLSHRVDTNSFGIKDQDDNDIVTSTLRTEDQVTIPVTPLSVSDMMTSSPQLLIDKDVEEGEISGELMAFMPEDNSLYLDIEDFTGIEPGPVNDNSSVHLSADTADDVGRNMATVASKTARNLVDYSDVVVHEKTSESDCALINPERLLPLNNNLRSSAIKNKDFASPVKDSGAQNNGKRHGSCTQEKSRNKKAKNSIDPTISSDDLTLLGDHPEVASQEDDSANKDTDKKRKKRVLTEESKAKRKRKERIKRAEKNRKLGVRRLKLQPVIKEKKIIYCRHYMNGRCHEGEKCKFSHDIIPLTKSKPCSHFARHACMKGDECPYDHQLSKYPCNNYLSNGFCNRGSDCMFSHEAPPSETPVNGETKVEQNPSSWPDNQGSKKQNNIDCSSCEKTNTNASSLPERNIVEITPKLSSRPPKGISFLSQEKLSLEPRSSPNIDHGVKDSVSVQDLKEITKTPLVTPHGVNFLSFGGKQNKPNLDQPNSGFPFKMGNGIGKSLLRKMEDLGLKYNDKQTDANIPTDSSTSTQKPILMPSFMSITSRRLLQSTVAFASSFVSGVNTNSPGDSSQNL